MSEECATEDWAQLVCVTDADTPPFMIGKDKFTIGRARGCDISHENNKLVSGTHCYILRDESGKVWLYDTSTNGTLLNSKIKLTKGECREIEHGDEFFVVHKKGEEDVNIGYVFQDLARLKEEEEDDSGDLEQTLEYEENLPPVDATILDDDINQIDEEEPKSSVKRKLTSPVTTDPEPSSKRVKTDTSGGDAVPSTSATTTTKTTAVTATKQEPVCKESADERESKGQAEDAEKGKKECDTKECAKSEGGSGGGGTAGAAGDDAFAETLTCIICQELLHDCISLQPCMHSFCAGCYSEWMDHSSECPSCRGKVDRINKNHIVNNLVEAYLKEHPEKRRPEEDTKELDAKNKITRDMLYPKKSQHNSDSDDYSDSDSNHSADSPPDSPPTILPAIPPAPTGGTIFGFGTPIFGAATNAYRAICRQCPGSTGQAPGLIGSAIAAVKTIFGSNQTATTTSTPTPASSTATPSTSGNSNNNTDSGDQPSTSGAGPSDDQDYMERDKKTMPEPPAYTCTVNQNHVLCQCCLQIFPDRRTERLTRPEIPPQQCTICYRAYCHAYWGCRKADCNGCLAKFQDMNFGKKVLPGLILENHYESEIFSNYLKSKKLAVRDVLQACIAKMEEGSYSCPDQVRYNITGETPMCFACALRNFKPLAYQYRADIPRDQLPADVTARSDCYWGKNCRTQRNKPFHATRFNHICEQTRT